MHSKYYEKDTLWKNLLELGLYLKILQTGVRHPTIFILQDKKIIENLVKNNLHIQTSLEIKSINLRIISYFSASSHHTKDL